MTTIIVSIDLKYLNIARPLLEKSEKFRMEKHLCTNITRIFMDLDYSLHIKVLSIFHLQANLVIFKLIDDYKRILDVLNLNKFVDVIKHPLLIEK